jgi:ABC-2 type transport system ATP-binding protein
MGLMHGPELLFLDEPSTGLDPQNRANLQEHVVALRARFGTTVVLTTHYLDEADSLAERVVVIDHGAVVADDTPDRLKAVHATDRMWLGLGSATDAELAASRVASAHPEARVVLEGFQVAVEMTGATVALAPLVRDLHAAGVPVRSAEVTRPTLDDVFLALTGRSLREGHSEAAGQPIENETEEVAA